MPTNDPTPPAEAKCVPPQKNKPTLDYCHKCVIVPLDGPTPYRREVDPSCPIHGQPASNKIVHFSEHHCGDNSGEASTAIELVTCQACLNKLLNEEEDHPASKGEAEQPMTVMISNCDELAAIGGVYWHESHVKKKAQRIAELERQLKDNERSYNEAYQISYHAKVDAEALRAEKDDLLARLKAAEKVVSKLPKTADGVPVVPDMKLFCPKGHEAGNLDSHVYCTTESCWDDYPGDHGGTRYEFNEVFSTREAADAARKQVTQ